ncbi:MAG: hypothetical protein ACP5T2_05585 [Thermoprotei archaeon]
MKFCPKDGSVLVPIKEKGKVYLVCKKCGYKEPAKEEIYVEKTKMDNKKKIKLLTEELPKESEEEREYVLESFSSGELDQEDEDEEEEEEEEEGWGEGEEF